MRCSSPLFVKVPPTPTEPSGRAWVPCGKCSACKTNLRNSWMVRLAVEAKVPTVFITLTYTDSNLYYLNPETWPSLRVSDFQAFMKRLRSHLKRQFGVQIRFYAIGEYGSQTFRPHYHAFLFGISPSNEMIDIISQCWSLGNIVVSGVTDARLMYVANFHVIKNNNHPMPELVLPEFTLMSRRPGIGNLDGKPELWQFIKENEMVPNYSHRVSLPRYWKQNLPDWQKIRMREQSKAYYDSLNTHQSIRDIHNEFERRLHFESNFRIKSKKNKQL